MLGGSPVSAPAPSTTRPALPPSHLLALTNDYHINHARVIVPPLLLEYVLCVWAG